MLAQILANALVAGASYALFALSFGLIYRVAGFLHVAHGAIYAVAAYAFFLAVNWLALPTYVAIISAVTFAALLGAGLELCVYRPLQKRGGSANTLLLASLGLMITLQNVIATIFTDSTQTVNNGVARAGRVILGARLTPVQEVSLAVGAAMAVLLMWMLQRTRFGRAVRAIANDSELSLIHGLNVPTIRLAVYAIASACVAIVGILDAYNTDLTPTMGFRLMLMGITACIIGGIGSVRGAYLGGFIVAFLQQGVAWTFSAQWQDAGVFMVLVLALIVRPQGVFGRPLRQITV